MAGPPTHCYSTYSSVARILAHLGQQDDDDYGGYNNNDDNNINNTDSE